MGDTSKKGPGRPKKDSVDTSRKEGDMLKFIPVDDRGSSKMLHVEVNKQKTDVKSVSDADVNFVINTSEKSVCEQIPIENKKVNNQDGKVLGQDEEALRDKNKCCNFEVRPSNGIEKQESIITELIKNELKWAKNKIKLLEVNLENIKKDWGQERKEWTQEKEDMSCRIKCLEEKFKSFEDIRQLENNNIENASGKVFNTQRNEKLKNMVQNNDKKEKTTKSKQKLGSSVDCVKNNVRSSNNDFIISDEMIERVDQQQMMQSEHRNNHVQRPNVIEDDHLWYELKERKLRRNNMIIRCLDRKKKLSQEDLFRISVEKLKIRDDEVELKFGRENMICIKFNSLEAKLKAFERKKEFRDSNIWLDDDHTRREIWIQKWLRFGAYQERSKGINVKVSYMKVIIGDSLWRFNEKTASLEQLPFRGNGYAMYTCRKGGM